MGSKLYTLLHCPHALPPFPNPQSKALPAPSADTISAPGHPTLNSNTLPYYSAPSLPNSSANSTKHGPTPPRPRALNSFTLSSPTFSSTTPPPLPLPYYPPPTPTAAPLPTPGAKCAKTPSAKCAKALSTKKKCSSATYVTLASISTASSHPSPPPHMGHGNTPYVTPSPLCPRPPSDTSAFPHPSFRLAWEHRGCI